jgi:CO/xanthine dehydrogenase Mo-binding subunit
MGTGCDTILAQMAAEVLECDVDLINTFSADSDLSPYDSGSYASSTTYITGKAVEKAAYSLIDRMRQMAAEMKGVEKEETAFVGTGVKILTTEELVTLHDLATKSMCFNTIPLVATESNSQPVSPPPYMVGMVEIELDPGTGKVDILDYVAVVDCGTVINKNLAKVQTEGGIVQGIGMALSEAVTYNAKGKIAETSFMQYKIPTRLDMGKLRIDFESSYEPTGPFGAKSIGEIVINTPSPAIAGAISAATGAWHRELPITPEKVLMAIEEE